MSAQTTTPKLVEPPKPPTMAQLAFREAKIYQCEVCGCSYKKIAEDGTEVPGCAACLTSGLGDDQRRLVQAMISFALRKQAAEFELKLAGMAQQTVKAVNDLLQGRSKT